MKDWFDEFWASITVVFRNGSQAADYLVLIILVVTAIKIAQAI